MKFKNSENIIVHYIGNTTRYCVPDDGFQKLIAYETPKGYWVHKDYRKDSNKKTKQNKK